MKFLIFTLLFLINIILGVAVFVLPEKKFLILILLAIFIILFFIYSYFVFFKILYSYFGNFTKDKIYSLSKIFISLIFVLIFVFIFSKIRIFENIKNDASDSNVSKLLENLSKDYKFYYIKDEKSSILKNYLDQIKLEIIDSVFQTSEYNELCKLVGKNLKKGSLIIAYNNNYNVLNSVTYNNILLNMATLRYGKKTICVYGDEVKSIYNFNENGLAIFSSIIEDSGFIVLEKNYESCDANLVFYVKDLKFENLKNLIIISKSIDLLGVKTKNLIRLTERTKVDFNFYGQDLVTEFRGIFSNIDEEVIAGPSYELDATSSSLLASISSFPVMIEKEDILFISAENILSNLYMQNIGNQTFARFLIYSRFSEYNNLLKNFEPEYKENFFTSYRYIKYLKIILFIVSPLFIVLFGIFGFRKHRSSK